MIRQKHRDSPKVSANVERLIIGGIAAGIGAALSEPFRKQWGIMVENERMRALLDMLEEQPVHPNIEIHNLIINQGVQVTAEQLERLIHPCRDTSQPH